MAPTNKLKTSEYQYRVQVVWRNVLIFAYLHIAGLYGLYYGIVFAQWNTLFWNYVIGCCASWGVTVGAHRLWTHKTFKAKLPFRILLGFWQTVSLQNDIYEWARDHRVHHKFTDTDADPHNSNRGFFFCHMGWLLVKKHRDVFTKGKTVDMSDIAADPVVKFQKKFYVVLAPVLCFGFPSFVPWYFWGESYAVSFNLSVLRYLLQLHGTWAINSVAHMFGTKPFDKNINAVENKILAFLGGGEGWHNYHHVFPWDYKAAEFGHYMMNSSCAIIEFMAKIGQAYDLKTISMEMVKKRAQRTGDGTRQYGDVPPTPTKEENNHHQYNSGHLVWGWDDRDMTQDDLHMAEIYHAKAEKSH